MIPLKLKMIADHLGGELTGSPELVIDKIETDSRKNVKDALFVALKGERFDAHDFIKDIAAAGAAAVVVDHRCDVDIPQIVVSDTGRALGLIGNLNRRQGHAKVVSMTGIGTEGIEKQFNDYLLSIPGKRRIKKDNKNNIIEFMGTYQEGKKAEDLYLSIDERIQFKAYTALKYAVEINQATSGSLVLIDAWTGEILAMVNSPSYNPNNRDDYESRRARNRSVTDSYEPGSTTKPLMETGKTLQPEPVKF